MMGSNVIVPKNKEDQFPTTTKQPTMNRVRSLFSGGAPQVPSGLGTALTTIAILGFGSYGAYTSVVTGVVNHMEKDMYH